jgi:uncharacterized protein YidB (DUF937 family)
MQDADRVFTRILQADLYFFPQSSLSLPRLKLVSFLRTIVMKRSTHFPKSSWEQSTSEAFCTAVVDLIQRHGAVSGIVKRMEQLGLGAVASSWLGSDVPVPIFSEQLHALFGTSVLRAFAARLELQPRDLVRRLSQTLPHILNQLASSQGLRSTSIRTEGPNNVAPLQLMPL